MAESIKRKGKQDLHAIFNSDLFSNFTQIEKNTIVKRLGVVQFKKGKLLFAPDKRAEHLYFLLKGLIRVFKPKRGGGNDEIARFAPGDIIGDFDFARGAKYDAYAEAVEDSTLVLFPGPGISIERFALEEPQLNSKLLLNAAAMVTGRIKATRKIIIESAYWVKELHRKVYEDPATGLWKQSFLDEEINQLLENPMALIMLKPDRFKILVDAMGHDAGDEAMLKIAAVLQSITRKLNRGWALRFKSNETGILINKCDAAMAETIARSLATSIKSLPPVALKGKEKFSFSGSIAWGIWPVDGKSWDSLFEGSYKLLLDTWKSGGSKIVRYNGKAL